MSPTGLRVLHCPTTVGGNPPNIARQERRLGLHSRSVAFSQDHRNYPVDEVLWDHRAGRLSQQRKCWALLLRAWRDFDVIHHNFGSSILPWWPPLRSRSVPKRLIDSAYGNLCRWAERSALRRKVIAVTYQGDDARQGDYCRRHFAISIANEVGSDYYSAESDEIKRKKIAWFDECADLIYALNPDLLRVLPTRAEFLPYAHIDLDEWVPQERCPARVPVLVHAPSHRGAKGTRHVLGAVERLRAEGIVFEFMLVENVSNQEARALYERADLVIDQLLAGWYGGFAVEAMALAKPVICYIRESDLDRIPPAMRAELPVVNATPDSIHSVLKECLTSRVHHFRELGVRSRRYVERWHDPGRVVSKLVRDYQRIAVRRAVKSGRVR
jgi:hypothetical protein